MSDMDYSSLYGQPDSAQPAGQLAQAPVSQTPTNQMDYSSLYGQTPASAQAANPSEENVGQTIKNNLDTLKSKANAVMYGIDNGAKTFSSTLAKLTAEGGKVLGIPEKYLPDAQAAQKSFEHAHEVYEHDPDSVGHPILSTLGNIGEQAGLTAPLSAGTGGAADIVGGASTLGKLAAGTASGAIQGGVMGGFSNTPGQSADQAFNPQNAKLGMEIGAALAPVAQVIGSSANALDKTETVQNQLTKIGAKTRPMASDMSGGVQQYLANNVLQKIPLVGTNPYRAAQATNLQSDIQNYIGSVSQQTMDATKTKIANTIAAHADQMNQTESDAWNTLNQTMKDSGIDSIPRTQSQPFLENLQNYTKKGILGQDADPTNPSVLSNKYVQKLQNLPDELSPQDHLDLKRDTWQQYSTLQNKVNAGNATADEADAAGDLRSAYWGLHGDVQDAVAGTAAEPAYQAANSITTGTKALFDPKNQKQLTGAIADMNNSQRGVDNYIKWLTNPNTNTRDVQQQIGFLGDEGTQAVSQIGLKNIMANSMDNSVNGSPVLNLSKFMDQYNNLPNSAQGLLHQPAIEQLKGLQQVAGDYLKSQQHGNISNAIFEGDAKTAGMLAGGAGIISNPVAGIPIALGTGALSFLARFAPAKQALIAVNKAAQTVGIKPGLSQYIMNGAKNTLIRAGVTIGVDQSGKININKPNEVTGTQAQHSQLAMNQSDISKYNSLPGTNVQPPQLAPEKYQDMIRSLDQGHDDYASNSKPSLGNIG